MCVVGAMTEKQAAKFMADLIKRELDIEIDATALRYFVRQEWPSLSLYAHAIHRRAHPIPEQEGEAHDA